MSKTKVEIDKQVQWNKIMHYCNYRERCTAELRAKLNSMEMESDMCEELYQEMIEIKMVDDQRFAQHFAEGKFRLKKWGKNRIQQELYRKGIPSKYIFDALDSISEEEYQETAERLFQTKKRRTKGSSPADKKAKIYRYMYYKGYEPEVIRGFF